MLRKKFWTRKGGAGTIAKTEFNLFVLCFCLLDLGLGYAWATQGEHLTAGEKTRVFNRIKKGVGSIESVTSKVIQEQHSSMFETPQVSRGYFHYKSPDELYWFITEPERSGFSISGDKARRWKGSPKASQSFDIRSRPFLHGLTSNIMALIKADFEWLKEHYRITIEKRDPIVLGFTPPGQDHYHPIDHLVVQLSPDLRSIDQIEIHDKDGDFTRLRFVEPKFNQPVPEIFKP